MGKKLIEWKDIYSVGYELFDKQHQQLIEMINELYSAFISGEAQEKAGNIINEMVDYTEYHFKTEEKYFDKYNFPETEEHKVAHDSFVKKAVELKNGFASGSVTVSYEIMNFLRQWLVEHIMGTDKKYTQFFKNINADIN